MGEPHTEKNTWIYIYAKEPANKKRDWRTQVDAFVTEQQKKLLEHCSDPKYKKYIDEVLGKFKATVSNYKMRPDVYEKCCTYMRLMCEYIVFTLKNADPAWKLASVGFIKSDVRNLEKLIQLIKNKKASKEVFQNVFDDAAIILADLGYSDKPDPNTTDNIPGVSEYQWNKFFDQLSSALQNYQIYQLQLKLARCRREQ